MPVPHFFARKDKPRVLVEFSNPHYPSEQESAFGASTHPRRDSGYSPMSPRPIFRGNSSGEESVRGGKAREESFDDDHYMLINARWLDHVNQSESIRPGRINDRRKYPRPRTPRNLLERNRLRLHELAAKQLQLQHRFSWSRSSPTPIQESSFPKSISA